MVKVGSINRFGKLDGVARAVDVDCGLAFFVGTQVIHGGEVVEVIHLVFEFFDVFSTDTQFFAGQVTMHRHRPRSTDTPVRTQGGHLAVAFLADQEMHGAAFSLQKFFHQAFANEAGGSCDEIMHSCCPCVFSLANQ